MSIATEIERIQSDKATIKTKLVELGLVTNTANLDTIAEAVSAIVNRGAVSVTIQEGNTYTIPAGYHNGAGTVSGVSGGGSYSLQSKSNIVPTKQLQTITADDGYYGLSDVSIAAIPDVYQDVSDVTAVAADVISGKIIVTADGSVVAGTMANNGAISKMLDTTTISYTIPKGYHSGTGKVQLVLETKSITPTKSAQIVEPTAGKVLSSVTVNAIPAAYQDVTAVTAAASDVLSGKKIVSANGTVVSGSMANNGAADRTINGMEATSVTIPAGYTTGGTISLTSSIEDALISI